MRFSKREEDTESTKKGDNLNDILNSNDRRNMCDLLYEYLLQNPIENQITETVLPWIKTSDPVLTLKACSVLIDTCEKEVFKSLLSLSAKEEFDHHFENERILGILIKRMNFDDSSYATSEFVHIIPILKNLSNSEKIQKLLVKQTVIPKLIQFLNFAAHQEQLDWLVKCTIQSTATLRNLAVSHKKHFVGSGVVQSTFLSSFQNSVDIVHNFSRLYSKLSLQRDSLDEMNRD